MKLPLSHYYGLVEALYNLWEYTRFLEVHGITYDRIWSFEYTNIYNCHVYIDCSYQKWIRYDRLVYCGQVKLVAWNLEIITDKGNGKNFAKIKKVFILVNVYNHGMHKAKI